MYKRQALIRWTGVQPPSCQPDAQTARRVLGTGIIDLAQHALYIGGALRRREAARQCGRLQGCTPAVEIPDLGPVASGEQRRCEAAEEVAQVGHVAQQLSLIHI